MIRSTFITTCLFFIFLYVSVVTCQHTTSVRFSPVPQPTSSGVVCIQVICPTDSLQPSCPSDCISGCKYVPDQCCPQVTVAICENSSSSSHGISSTTASATPSSSATSSFMTSLSSSIVSPSSSSSSPTDSPKPNSGAYLRPTVYSTLVMMILISIIIV